jgi:hypothetical protein
MDKIRGKPAYFSLGHFSLNDSFIQEIFIQSEMPWLMPVILVTHQVEIRKMAV